MRFHTITACKAPCNLGSGIGFPLANGPGLFDSGELGFGPTISTGALYGRRRRRRSPITAGRRHARRQGQLRKGGHGPRRRSIANGCVGTDDVEDAEEPHARPYTYFCRIHPFMRGAFRVVPKKRVPSGRAAIGGRQPSSGSRRRPATKLTREQAPARTSSRCSSRSASQRTTTASENASQPLEHRLERGRRDLRALDAGQRGGQPVSRPPPPPASAQLGADRFVVAAAGARDRR